MRLLAFDLTSDRNSIALIQDGTLIATESWETAHLRRQQVFNRTTDLLRHHGCAIAALDGITVDIGPGSYFGLRVAYTFAQGLAFPHGIPVTGATSGEIMAWEWFTSGHNSPFASLHDIRRGHLARALFTSAEHVLTHTEPGITLIGHSGLDLSLPDGSTIATPDWSRLGALLSTTLLPTTRLIPEAVYPSAEALARLTLTRLQRGLPLAPVKPLYLHPPVAEKNGPAL